MAKARSRQAALAASAGLSVLAGCSMAPAYHPPAMAPAAAYKESGAVAGG
jgi:hypothetical protein